MVAEVLPEGKVEAIRRLKAAYGQVAFKSAMAINDAPALAESDGLATGTGTDVAESADVVLMSGNLQGVPNAIALSKSDHPAISTCIRSWAFAYNTALTPAAAGARYFRYGAYYCPRYSPQAMAMSSVFVLGRWLRRFRAPMWQPPSDTSTT